MTWPGAGSPSGGGVRGPVGADGDWFEPRSALFWVYFLAVLAGPLVFVAQAAGMIRFGGAQALAALPVTAATLLFFRWVLFALDPFRARRRLVAPILLGFVWGASVWPGLALWANDHVTHAITNLAGDSFASTWQAAIAAPIDEEFIKAIGIAVVAVLFRSRLRRPMDGFLIGGFVGLGAQISEDVLYSVQTSLAAPQSPVADVLIVAVLRLVTALTSHWSMSALAGVGIVVLLIRTDRSWGWRLGFFALFYGMAVAMHFIFDSPRPDSLGRLVTFLPVIIDLLIFGLAYRWVLGTERKWLRATISQPVMRTIGTEPQLASLLTRRSRRRARAGLRAATRMDRGQARRYERDLIDRVELLSVSPPPPHPMWNYQQTMPRQPRDTPADSRDQD
ncbi:PrsW family intramembrane metalloprotease [Nocardia sp. SYP-A9097]|uniref:PrsW family intramembrane metalloprotease n=1 Tax=Nocardia sp. SYP-A9097 TaxID=2663237 RepID=UPI00129C0CF3|nr:PrsW family intramembrane metalloprotease [Nocardia sp. SYP-A9097]MRH91839.1 PrsW family intramembrane metalloprotease [Nocardia sp. SYP-A9097]